MRDGDTNGLIEILEEDALFSLLAPPVVATEWPAFVGSSAAASPP